MKKESRAKPAASPAPYPGQVGDGPAAGGREQPFALAVADFFFFKTG